MKHIEEISVYALPDTKRVHDRYDFKLVPDLSAENIEVLMNKINEIIDTVNQLLPPGE